MRFHLVLIGERGDEVASLKDVANLANVSPTTVSRVLNEDPSLVVPNETRQRVLAAAEQIGYRVKTKHREIGRNSIQRVGILAYKSEQYELNDPYFLSIRQGVEAQCKSLGYRENVVFQWSEERADYSKLDTVDGLVIIGDNLVAAERFEHWGRRAVFVDSNPNQRLFNSVMVDFERATRDAIDHLLSIGYRKIGHIGAVNRGKKVDPRDKFFRAYMASMDLLEHRNIHVADDWTINDGYQIAQQCLDQGNLPEAFFVASDPLAIGVIRRFIEAGVRVPEDVAIVSFDDIEVSAFVTPPLTTIRVPTEAMGRTAVDLLVNGLGSHNLPLQVTVPTELVIRESCGSKLVRATGGVEQWRKE